jgi:hypothetical protein
MGVTLQIASSFLLATSGRAVRCNLYVFKEKTQRIFAAIPHATHCNDTLFILLNCKKILIYLKNAKRNKPALIYPCLGVYTKRCFDYILVMWQPK